MPRNKDILTEKELFVKTSRIIEQAINGKINLILSGNDNKCAYLGKLNPNNSTITPVDATGVSLWEDVYNVWIASPPVKHIAKYTALLHELAHLLYKTPFTLAQHLIHGSENKGLWFNPRLAFHVFNVLEDQRIESHLMRYYLAYRKRFTRTRKALGTTIQKDDMDINNPLNVLLAIRFKNEEAVKDAKYFKEYKEALEKVEGMDSFGAIRVLLSLRDKINEFHTERSKRPPAERNEPIRERVAPEKSKDKGDMSMPQELKKTIKKSQELAKEANVPNSARNKEFEEYIKDKQESVNKAIENTLKEGKKKGEKEFHDIRGKLLGDSGDTPNVKPPSVKMIERESRPPTPDNRLANKLNKVFRKVKAKAKTYIDIDGDGVDVEEYVDRFIEGTSLNKCLTNTKNHTGASIVVSVDGSTSMAGSRMFLARNLLATLFRATKSIPNVEVKGNIWGSNGSGIVGVTDINNENDVKYLNVHKKYFATPTHIGLEYSRRQLKDMKGRKKLLIFITDGVPNYMENNVRVKRDKYMDICKKSANNTKKVASEIICIAVGNRLTCSAMQEILGKKNVLWVSNIKDANEKVIRQFKHLVLSATK